VWRLRRPGIFILIEGADDEIFFSRIIKPCLEQQYNYVGLWQYACEPYHRVTSFLKNIQAMRFNHLCIADLNNAPCTTFRKSTIGRKFPGLDLNHLVIVTKEIESWYLAGLDAKTCKKLRISVPQSTDSIDKEQFERLIPKRFHSRIDFLLEITKYFSINTAKQKSTSFLYFVTKHSI
jgi:hypothetical protein